MAFEFDFDIKNLSCWIKIESWRKGNFGLAVNWNNPIRDAGRISLKLQDRHGIKSKLQRILLYSFECQCKQSSYWSDKLIV